MLVLTRKRGEMVLIGDDVVVTVLSVHRSRVRIGIDAPDGVRITRHEIEVTMPAQPVLSPADREQMERQRRPLADAQP